MSTINVFDFLIIICGFYMAFNGILMKTKGRINPGIVLSRNTSPDAIKDKEGFINYMWWKLVAMGLICAVAGIFNVVMAKFGGNSEASVMLQLIMNMIFFALLMVYAVISMRAQKKYITK